MTLRPRIIRWKGPWRFAVHRCEFQCRLRLNLGHIAIVWERNR